VLHDTPELTPAPDIAGLLDDLPDVVPVLPDASCEMEGRVIKHDKKHKAGRISSTSKIERER